MKDSVLKKQTRLHEIHVARARWWKKLSRACTAIDKLNDEEKRLLKPRKLQPHEITGEHHKIMDPEFFDDSEVLGEL